MQLLTVMYNRWLEDERSQAKFNMDHGFVFVFLQEERNFHDWKGLWYAIETVFQLRKTTIRKNKDNERIDLTNIQG